ncbi:unnamed protein product [Darwinula stevensoni]|uniref:Conserved oligomeric Golgi complex subunit 2 n=1 Tax=Darwinula stevensoni TaxID=69355 RepID=A0A7R9A3Q6_9CRUS|nr:unnamed protein product [Darwinula stevensoni]CAG0891091.1 unnamed protein product [Darwinula stevensoni]
MTARSTMEEHLGVGSGKVLSPVLHSPLSFHKEEFLKEDFNVDEFILKHQGRISLETLRDDLGIYLKLLRTSMIELINKDYADFVNLSSNLVGMDKSISNLEKPLQNFHGEVLAVKQMIEGTIEAVQQELKLRQEKRERKAELERLMHIIHGVEKIEKLLNIAGDVQQEVPGDLVERVASELNQLHFYVSKTEGISVIRDLKPRISLIGNVLQASLEQGFLESLEKRDVKSLGRCLRIHATIDRIPQLELLFRSRVVEPYMKGVISEGNLHQEPHGLTGMFSQILEFIPTKCTILHESAYSMQRYMASMEFLSTFEQLCGSQASVARLRNHPSYVIFINKWNLPVYFQMRFQEISGALEKALCVSPLSRGNDAESSLLLHGSQTLSISLLRCWDAGVYIPSLVHRFWKLSLQLLSRFNVWLTGISKKEIKFKEGLKEDAAHGSMAMSRSMSSSVLLHQKRERESSPQPHLHRSYSEEEHITLDEVVPLVADIRFLLEHFLPFFLKEIVLPKLRDLGLKNEDIIARSLDESMAALEGSGEMLRGIIEVQLISQSVGHLRFVSDIPRLYRRTNREVPSKSSTYVTSSLRHLQEFFDQHKQEVNPEILRSWIKLALLGISKQYLSATSEVLTSVQKMEESLRRLKKAKEKGRGGAANANAPLGNAPLSDDDKIRLQLCLDVNAFAQMVESLGIQGVELEDLQSLIKIVEDAKRTSHQGTFNVQETLVMPDVFEDEENEKKSAKENALIWVERTLLVTLWATLQFIFFKLEFGAVFFICSIFYLIWRNLRTRPQKPGELSAYSVFNKKCQAIHGTVTAEQLQREFFLPGL